MGQAITPVLDTELEKVKEQLATAAALRKQGLDNDMGSGYHGGSVYIVGNPLASIAQSLGGAFLGNRARERQGQLEQQQNQERNGWLSQMPSPYEVTPQAGPVQEGEAPLPDVERPVPARALAQATQAWTSKAPKGMEGIQQFGIQQSLLAPQRQAESEQRAADRNVQLQYLSSAKEAADAERRRHEERMEQMRIDGRAFIKSLGGGGGGSAGKPQLVYGEDSQGYQLFADGSLRKVEGLKRPATAAQQKLDDGKAEKVANKSKVDEVADETLKSMAEANELGAYSNKGTNPAMAIGKYALSTEPGKEVGRALNLDVQTARDIADTKKTNLFLDTVKNSVSASQLNSDKELQFYMQTLGNPRSSYEAQTSAIKWIKRNYGKQMQGGAPAAPGAPAPAAPAVPKSIVREVPLKDGRIGVEYSDGTRGYK
jgi:hypothetical protein